MCYPRRMPTKKPLTLDATIQKLDKRPLRKLAKGALADGKSVDEAVAAVVAAIDAAIPWALIIPGPLGIVIEALDGPIALAIATPIVRGVAEAQAKKAAKAAAEAKRV